MEQQVTATEANDVEQQNREIPPVHPIVHPFFEQDGITVYHGDAFELLPKMAGSFVIVTDPPYGTGWVTNQKHLAMSEFKARGEKESWDVWRTDWLDIVTFHRAAVFCPDFKVAELGQRFGEYRLRYYVKNNVRPKLGHSDAASVEPIVIWPTVARSSGGCHKEAWNANRFDRHLTCQKPLEIMRWIVHDMTQDGDVVLDPFAGSGTTARAAKDCGIRCVCIEAIEERCEIIVKRLRQAVLPFVG